MNRAAAQRRRVGERAGVRADVITDFICFTPCHPLKTAKNLISLQYFLWTNYFTKRKVQKNEKGQAAKQAVD
jgi:hypothetical protein